MLNRLDVIPPYALSFFHDFLREDAKKVRAGEGFMKHFKAKKYSLTYVKQEEFISLSRLIHNWIELGLIDESVRDNKGAWKRFSLQDLIWIRIIVKLRWFGLPIDKIEKVKQFLFTDVHFHFGEYLFPYVTTLVLLKVPLNLIVFPDGEAHVLSEPQIQVDKEKLLDYISINLNEVVGGVLNDPNLKPDYDILINLSDKELVVLNLIRNGEFKTVELVLKNGKIERFSATQNIELDTRLGDLLKDDQMPFEEVLIQKNDGKVVSIKRTIKEKV